MHRLAARHAQRPASVYHLHAIHRFSHVQATRLFQRPQIPPPDEPVLSRAYPHDPALTFVPDERADRTLARGVPRVVAPEDERFGVRSAEVEQSDLLFVSSLISSQIDKQISTSTCPTTSHRRAQQGRTVKRYCGVTCGLSATVRTICACWNVCKASPLYVSQTLLCVRCPTSSSKSA
jgi:hypothetical protein